MATATVSGSTVSVAGVAVGRTTVTIAGPDGRRSALPVQVYDPMSMDAGELTLAFTTQFQSLFRCTDLFCRITTPDWSGWRPVAPEGYYSLGSLVVPPPYADPNGTRAVLLVKGNTATALAPTSEYGQVTLSFAVPWGVGAVYWRPSCPDGYRALGLVVTQETAWPVIPTPPAYPTACVRDDLTVGGSIAAAAPSYSKTLHYDDGSWLTYAAWQVDQPVIGSHSGAYLAPGTAVYADARASSVVAPEADPAVRVLDVDLPLLGEAPEQAVVPELTADPAPETAPLFSRAILVPCSIVKDPLHDATWQIAHSPFYRLERSVVWRLIAHNFNNTSVEQPNSVQFTKGITTEEATRIWNATSVSVSAEAGIELKAFSAKVTTTVNREMGYETLHSLSELNSRTDTLAMQTPPKKAVALWQQVSRFTLYRHNGARLEVADFWEAGTDTFYADEYPRD